MRFGWLAGSLALFSAVALAQSDVPVIRFDSVAEPLDLPDNVYFGARLPVGERAVVGELLNWRVQRLILHP